MKDNFERALATWVDEETVRYSSIDIRVRGSRLGVELVVPVGGVGSLAALQSNCAMPARGPHYVIGSGGLVLRRIVTSGEARDSSRLAGALASLACASAGRPVDVADAAQVAVAPLFPMEPVLEPGLDAQEAARLYLLAADGARLAVGRHHRVGDDIWSAVLAEPATGGERQLERLKKAAANEARVVQTILAGRAVQGCLKAMHKNQDGGKGYA